MLELSLIIGIVFIIKFLWIIIDKNKEFSILKLLISGSLVLLLIMIFSYIILFSIESILFYIFIIFLEIIGIKYLNHK